MKQLTQETRGRLKAAGVWIGTLVFAVAIYGFGARNGYHHGYDAGYDEGKQYICFIAVDTVNDITIEHVAPAEPSPGLDYIEHFIKTVCKPELADVTGGSQ